MIRTAYCTDDASPNSAEARPAPPPQEPAALPDVSAADVWDQLWGYRPADDEDDALLAREKSSRRWAIIVRGLEETFGSIVGIRTIELGSGRGDLSALLAERGATVTLLDASTKALQQARHRFDRLGLAACYERGDILEMPEQLRGRFDVALSSGVAEHFRGRDRRRVIRAHCEVLKPGGVAVVSVPNSWCLPYRLWKLCLEVRGWWPYGMEIPYTRRELIRRARQAGFERLNLHCLDFLQSLGVHMWRLLCGRRPSWACRPSRLDANLGFTLLLLAQRGTGGRGRIEPAGTRSRPEAVDPDSHAVGGTDQRCAAGSAERHFLRRGRGLEFDMEAQWVRALIPPAARRIVDVGCGIGGLFPATGVARTVGVDRCAAGLVHTGNRFPSTPLVCAAAERLPFAGQAFDALTCQHVIEHLENSRQAFQEWFRILRPGGLLLLLTPNALFRDPAVFADDTHVRIFGPHALCELVTSGGFKIVDVRTLGLPWFRDYRRIPSGWRLRRLVARHARLWSEFGIWRWKGQTLCCAARRPSE